MIRLNSKDAQSGQLIWLHFAHVSRTCSLSGYQLLLSNVARRMCRYDGWVTELKDEKRVRNVSEASGIDNLLYSSDVDFSCFADLAVVSPVDYRKEGEGSLMQVRP